MTDRDELGRFTKGKELAHVIDAEVVTLEPDALSLPAVDAVELDEDHFIMSIHRNRVFRRAIAMSIAGYKVQLRGAPDLEDEAAEAVGTEELLAAFTELDTAKPDGDSEVHQLISAWREECKAAHVEQLTEAWADLAASS